MVIGYGDEVMITNKHNADVFPPAEPTENKSKNKILDSDRTNQNKPFYRVKFREETMNSGLKSFETF